MSVVQEESEQPEEQSVVSIVTKALSKYLDVPVSDVAWLDLHVGIKLVQMLSPRLLQKYRTIPAAFKALSTASQGKRNSEECETVWRVDFVSATTKYLGMNMKQNLLSMTKFKI